MLAKVKQAVQAAVKFVKKIIDMVKFFMTQVGMVVGIAILIAILALLVYVLIVACGHAIARFFNEDYAGISTEGDYAYLVSSIGYAGYDSLITEKVWQEFNAYEYAVLMDVAEFLYEGQEEYFSDSANTTDSYGPFPDEYISFSGEQPSTLASGPKSMPYLDVIGEYDWHKLKLEGWKKCVLEGQVSARFGYKDTSELIATEEYDAGLTNRIIVPGGNRDVMPPTIMYEFKRNPNEPEAAGSLVPYIAVMKEQISYNYYTVGGRGAFEGKNEDNEGVPINASNIDLVNLAEFSNKLNAANPFLPLSAEWTKYMANNPDLDPNTTDAAWPIADEDEEQHLYYTTSNQSIVYKAPLSKIIGRYLPKSSVLTAWYYAKDNDSALDETRGAAAPDDYVENPFNIDGLMSDIKRVYDYYCWYKTPESLQDEDIMAIRYHSGDGSVVRDGEGGPAERYPSTQKIATTNEDTFIHFGQAGLETNRFDVFVKYDIDGTGQPKGPEYNNTATVPIITELLSENAVFLDRFGLDTTVTYRYSKVVTMLTRAKVTYLNSTIPPAEYIANTYHKNHMRLIAPGIRGTIELTQEGEECATCRSLQTTSFPIAARNGRAIFLSIRERNRIELITPILEEIELDPEEIQIQIVIPYEASEEGEPRGKTAGTVARTGFFPSEYYTSGLGKEVSEYINQNIIKEAENVVYSFDANANPTSVSSPGVFNDSASYKIEQSEKQFVNYTYVYPEMVSELDSGGISAKPTVNLVTYKDNVLPFYNIGVTKNGESTSNPSANLEAFNNAIEDKAKGRYDSTTPIFDVAQKLILSKIPAGVPKDGTITDLYVNGFYNGSSYGEYATPKYTPVSEQDGKFAAIFDVDDHDFVLKLNIDQKRMAVMLVTDVETWAKSATYSITITQNMFDYSDYRFVIPHSYFNFGLKKFHIDENPDYRVDYYKEYFSRFGGGEPGIKENDVTAMMLQWEEYAKDGNDVAYAFMRDLYKLILLNREKGKDNPSTGSSEEYILGSAYSYFYIPESIWDFREGVTQESYWTERLASDVSGPEALTTEELERMRHKKEELYWQNLEYYAYPECINSDETVRVYALFPFGSPYTRTYYMEKALEDGKFDDGGYIDGHRGADWTSRSKMSDMLNVGDGNLGSDAGNTLASRIYNYELKSRTLRKLLGNTTLAITENKKNNIDGFLNITQDGQPYSGNSGNDVIKAAYKLAKDELRQELSDYASKSPIVAVAPGIVTKAEYNCYSGFVVGLQHHCEGQELEKAETSYVHMKRWPEVQTGDIVGAGTVLGYEGTTGNSSGVHLHQNISIGGVSGKSPAAYMGPIFAPFYNADKVKETAFKLGITNIAATTTDEAILASEYYSLVRTVLMQEFEDGKAKYRDFEVSSSGVAIAPSEQPSYFASSTLVLEDGYEYIQFDSTAEKGAFYMIGQGDKTIIKVGNREPIFYLCDYTIIYKDNEGNIVTPDSSGNLDDYTSFNGYINGNEVRAYYRVNSKEEIEFDETTLNKMVKIKTLPEKEETSYEMAVVIWGNNVPLRPLFRDSDHMVDIGALIKEKVYIPNPSEYNGSGPDKNAEYENVKASKANFDYNLCKEKTKLPKHLANYTYYYPSPLAVHVYEAQVSKQQGPHIREGHQGSSSGDLVALKLAFKAAGLDPENKLVLDGNYSDEFIEILKGPAAELVGVECFANGRLGGYTYSADYDIRGVTTWNAYVTYGGIEEATNFGRNAAKFGATMNGLRTTVIEAIIIEESGFNPESESDKFCEGRTDNNWVTLPVYPDDTTNPDEAGATIIYKGVRKSMRRAQGLMQLAPPYCLSWASEYIGAHDINRIMLQLKSPYGNAVIGSERIAEHILTIQNDPAKYNRLWNIVYNSSASSAFNQMSEECGLPAIDIALAGCAAYMFNKGGSYVDDIIGQMEEIVYYPSSKIVSYQGLSPSKPLEKEFKYGYSHRVMTYIVQNEVKSSN